MQVERDVVLQFRPSVRLFQNVPIVILFDCLLVESF